MLAVVQSYKSKIFPRNPAWHVDLPVLARPVKRVSIKGLLCSIPGRRPGENVRSLEKEAGSGAGLGVFAE